MRTYIADKEKREKDLTERINSRYEELRQARTVLRVKIFEYERWIRDLVLRDELKLTEKAIEIIMSGLKV